MFTIKPIAKNSQKKARKKKANLYFQLKNIFSISFLGSSQIKINPPSNKFSFLAMGLLTNPRIFHIEQITMPKRGSDLK